MSEALTNAIYAGLADVEEKPRGHLGAFEMKDNNITIRGGIGFFGVCFLLFWDFNDNIDLYDAIIHGLMK